jgi:hypothetical protein
MPLARKNPTIRIGVSPHEAADMLRVDYGRVILPAIRSGDLGPVYSHGNARRVLVSDLERYVREKWVSHG